MKKPACIGRMQHFNYEFVKNMSFGFLASWITSQRELSS